MKISTLCKKTVALALSAISVVSLFGIVPTTATAESVSRFDKKVTYGIPSSIDTTVLGNSIVTGNVSFYLNTTENGKTKREPFNENSGYVKIYDGDTETQLMGSFRKWANESGQKEQGHEYDVLADSYNIGRGGKYSYDIVYDLNRSQIFTSILISGGVGVFSTGAYDIYASETEEDLFSEENLVYKYDKPAAEATTNQRHTVFNIGGKMTARYFAMRIYNPLSTTDETILKSDKYYSRFANYVYLRLNEFNIYRESSYIVERKQYNGFLGSSDAALAVRDEVNLAINKEKNLLRDSSPSSAFLFRDGETYENLREYIKDFATSEVLTSDYPDFTLLTDGDSYLGDDISCKTSSKSYFAEEVGGKKQLIDDESRMYYQFNYALKYDVDVSAIGILGSDNYQTCPSHFKVSVADSESALFTDSATFNSEDIYSSSTLNKVKPKNNGFRGKYVGFRIICGINEDFLNSYSVNACYLRLREFYVQGSYVGGESNTISQQMVFATDGKDAMYSAGKASVTSDILTDEYGRYPANTVYKITAPGSLKDQKGVRRSFLYWTRNYNSTNPADRIYTPTLNLTKKEANGLILVYGDTDHYVTYTFCDTEGNVLHTARVKRGFFLERADYDIANAKVPDMCGFDKYYDTVTFGSRTANMQMWSVDIYGSPAVDDITVTPQYKVSTTQYSVTFNGTTEKYAFDARVTKKSTNGQSVIWCINGKPMHKGTDFTFYVFGDMQITTVSSGSAPIIALYNPSGDSATQNGTTLAFFALINKGSYYIEECGLLINGADYIDTADYKNSSYNNLSYSSSAQKVVANKHSDIGFMVSLKGVKRHNTRVVRAYIKYRETEKGAIKTAYSDVLVYTAK